jgi:hypothetical protein
MNIYTNIRIFMNEDERRKLIVHYISNHQGCKAEEVVEGVKKHLSRVPVYGALEDLIKDGTVKDQATNRRDHKLYVDFNNLLVSVPKELEGFKKAYLNLLQESKERIRQKDFSKIARILGIDEPDPFKWDESEIHRFLEFERKNHSNSVKEIHEFNEQNLIKIISNARQENALNIAKALFFPAYDVSSFDFSALNYGAIGIFQTFANAYFYLSMTWSQIIHDKEALRKLYEAVYTEISDIQFHLTEFLTSNNFSPPHDTARYIMRIGISSASDTLSMDLLRYILLDMQRSIEPIADFFFKLNDELDYKYFDLRSYRKFLELIEEIKKYKKNKTILNKLGYR